MQEKNLLWKILAVIVPVALAAYFLYSRPLKYGIDLAGGYSLLYEIDDTGLTTSDKRDLAERVMAVLQRRVDPNRIRNLVWRPIGQNRLEIQMPRPPGNVEELRTAWQAAQDALFSKNVARKEIEGLLAAAPDQRSAILPTLLRGVSERQALLQTAVAKYDAYQAARKADPSADATTEAQAAYEDAVQQVLVTNVPKVRLTTALELKKDTDARKAELDEIREQHAERLGEIDALIVASDAYDKVKGVLADPADLQRLLRGAGVLEFRILPKKKPDNPTAFDTYKNDLAERGPRYRGDGRHVWLPVEKPEAFMHVTRDQLKDEEAVAAQSELIVQKYVGQWYVLGGGGTREAPDRSKGLLASKDWALKAALATRDYRTNRPAVSFTLNARGGALFGDMTGNNLQQPLCIVLDGVAISWANIIDRIRDRGQITGDFTQQRVSYIVRTLEAGSLPARLKETPLMTKSIGPSLGETNRAKGLQAAVYGLICVAAIMAVYYMFTGLVADLAVAMNLLLVLGVMSALQATFTLPGIAGLILTVGMAVDANVLIYERIREEILRGASLRMALKLGYEKAFSTILDANITTLITCVILGYVGSEEIKGFAITLGLGIVTSMYTALFVTRLIFTLLVNARILKSLPMLHLIRTPNIDWLSKKRVFWPISVVLVGLGLALVAIQPAERQLDIEFLGGTSAQIAFHPGKLPETGADTEVRDRVSSTDASGAAGWLLGSADRLEQATVTKLGDGHYRVSCSGLSPLEIEALITPADVLGDEIALGGATLLEDAVELRLRGTVIETEEASATATAPAGDAEGDQPPDAKALSLDQVREIVTVGGSRYARDASRRLAAARIQTVETVGDEEGDNFEVITTETSKKLVQVALINTFGESLDVQMPIPFNLVTSDENDPAGAYPINEEANQLQDVIGGAAPFDVTAFKGGMAMVFDFPEQPQTVDEVKSRIKSMRLQPDFEAYGQREFEVFGLTAADRDPTGTARFSKVAISVFDDAYPYDEDPDEWADNVAKTELELVQAALNSEQSLRKVSQFAPQVAGQATNQAALSILLALAAIVGYIWLRFGSMQFGLAAIVALVHDVSIALGLVTATYFIHNTFFGDVLQITDIKIDLAMVAAFLTIIGYSLNDTIVVFDRIRENRGKLATLSPVMMNNAINQCLSRTVMTSLTTLIVVVVMYVVGGAGIHGFSFALIIGVIVGTYSSIGIATPLLADQRTLRLVMIVLGVLAVVGLSFLATNPTVRMVVSGIAVVVGLFLLIREIRSGSGARMLGPGGARA